MTTRGWFIIAALLGTFAGAEQGRAQGTTTGAITGTIAGEDGRPIEGAQVQVINRATGFSVGTMSRANGLYFVQGLEVGGRYEVTVRRIGYEAETRSNVGISLSQATRVDFQLSTQVVRLTGVIVTAEAGAADISPTRQGVATTVSDSVIGLLPSLSRDFTDFVKLTPQVSQPTLDAPSAGGAYNRLNNFTIDGANQNDRFNLGSSEGQPGSAAGGRLISIDAVKEFQVLLSPTDVRQGNFAGMLVNAVTKSGTNEFSGGATVAYRSPQLAANEDFLRDSDLQVRQYSIQLGGPIIRDRLHFFIAPEWQARSAPATGPALNSGYIDPDTIARIRTAMASRFEVGTAELVTNDNPLTNIFARLDYQFSPIHRAVLRQLWNRAEQDAFSRNTSTFNNNTTNQNSGFRLGSNAFARENRNNSTVFQLFSTFASGAANEIIAGYNTISDVRLVPVSAPEISVAVTPIGGTTNNASVTFGTEQFSPNNILEQDIAELSENFTIPMGAHTITVGGRFEYNRFYNNFAQRSYGVYKFADIAALEADTPLNYAVGYDNGGGIAADFRTHQYSLYAQDQWAATPTLTVNFGLRADIPRFVDRPVDNPDIRAAFANATTTTGDPMPAIGTSDVPGTQVLFSPRVGVNWDINGDRMMQLRGNIGIFTGPPPFILVANAFSNNGLGLVTLLCSGTGTPAFTTDIGALPKNCAGSPVPAPGAAGTAGVNVTDPDLKYPQNFTTSLGFDRQLPWGVVATVEGLYRKAINGLMVRDLNFRGPKIDGGGNIVTDVNGRVLYSDAISATGSVSAGTGQRVITSLKGVTFSEGVIQVTNQSADYNYSISGQLKKRFGETLDMTAAYTYMQAKDVMSLTSDRAISNWRNGRQYAGLESSTEATTSYFQRPHRLMLFGTYTAPWRTTDVSIFYEGMSGTPFTYTVNGDLNGDGSNVNDPIYVPLDATDLAEARVGTFVANTFALNPLEAQRFDDFVDSQECLREQRGRIMERNSCRSPWQNRMDLSLRQSIPEFAGQRLSIQLDVVNFLNLLNSEWGQIELPNLSDIFPQQPILRQRSRTSADQTTSLPNVTFEIPATGNTGPFYKRQDQTSNFYQMQLTLRYSF